MTDDLATDSTFDIVELFGAAKGHSLAPASPEEFAGVSCLAVERDGKRYLTCQVRRKNIRATPEEAVRQLWVWRLVNTYGYPIERLQVEYPITFGRDTSKKADIVVFDADQPTVPYIVVEVKKTTARDGKDQLKSYTHATGAPLALWSNGVQDVVWHRKNPNYFVEVPDLPRATETIEDVVGTPWTVDHLVTLEQARERSAERARTLRDMVVDLEDEVLANAGVDVFEEVFKLLFAKLYDEWATFNGLQRYLRFRNVNTAAQVKAAVQDLFDDAKRKWPGVFDDDARVRLTPEHLQICVGSLEEWKLFNSNLDIIDDAFEYLATKYSKGEKGQYFTPRWVIDMCVKMLNPREQETVVDTAAGSAGFTVHAMFHVWAAILEDMGIERSHLFTMEDKPERCRAYVGDKVFAIDFDERAIRVARSLNLIAGDGHTNVLHLNTLDWKRWPEIAKDEDWSDTYGSGFSRLRRLRDKGATDYRHFNFDVVMANPPFAGDIKQHDMLMPYDLARKANGKLENAVPRDLLFIERNLDFLKPGGRMAVVLPQGRFNNSGDKRLREWIMERARILAVVGLEPNSFKPHTGTRTSVLFIQKWNDDPKVGPLCPRKDDYDIFFATQRIASKDTRGDKIYRKGSDGYALRDAHGHPIVAHDLFNHEGATEDGIAEAFQEFARREGLSFFQ